MTDLHEVCVNGPLSEQADETNPTLQSEPITRGYCLSAVCSCAIVVNSPLTIEPQMGFSGIVDAPVECTRPVAMPLGEENSTNSSLNGDQFQVIP